jgi:hypothetical protein
MVPGTAASKAIAVVSANGIKTRHEVKEQVCMKDIRHPHFSNHPLTQ